MNSLNFSNSEPIWVVQEAQSGDRLDSGLATYVGTRSKAQRMIKLGIVSINGQIEKAQKRALKTGDQIEYQLPPSLPENARAVAHPLEIIFEDESIILVNKPSGMVIHPSPGHYDDTLVNYLLYHWGQSVAQGLRPGIVHRIDKDTSGLIVVSKTATAQAKLAEQFRVHSIKRTYRAFVWGELIQPQRKVDLPIGRHPKERLRFAVKKEGKPSVTHFKLIKGFSKLSYIECQLETGRTHQIRVHMSHLGHPLIGDPLYSQYRDLSQVYPKPLVERLKAFRGQALHAMSLGFIHPQTGEPVYFESPLPPAMEELLGLLTEVTGEG